MKAQPIWGFPQHLYIQTIEKLDTLFWIPLCILKVSKHFPNWVPDEVVEFVDPVLVYEVPLAHHGLKEPSEEQ